MGWDGTAQRCSRCLGFCFGKLQAAASQTTFKCGGFKRLASWRGCVFRCQALPLHLQRQFKSYFGFRFPLAPSPSRYLRAFLLLTLIHIHVRQMANGCTVKWNRFLMSAFLARAQRSLRITWPAFVMVSLYLSLSPSVSIIVYDDWVPLWTRIHSTLFTTVQCVRLFVVHSSRISRFKFQFGQVRLQNA